MPVIYRAVFGFYSGAGNRSVIPDYISKGFNSFKYFAVFNGLCSLADLNNGNVTIFDMKEALQEYEKYNNIKSYLARERK